MITVYYVKDDEGRGEPHLTRHAAEITHAAVLPYYRPDRGETLPVVEEAEVDSLSDQTVFIKGSMIDYQFNRESMGERRFKRRVTGIYRDETGWLWGEVEVLGRRVKVFGGTLAVHWHGRAMLGYSD